MISEKYAQKFEIKLWNLLIPFMESEGPLMRNLTTFKTILNNRLIFLVLLVFLWAKIGFIAGMVTGRLILLIQFP